MHQPTLLAVISLILAAQSTALVTVTAFPSYISVSTESSAVLPNTPDSQADIYPRATTAPTSHATGGYLDINTHINAVCSPLNSTREADLAAPCNVAMLLMFECTFGAAEGLLRYKEVIAASNASPTRSKAGEHNVRKAEGAGSLAPPPQQVITPNVQRICACESQFFAALSGCAACEHTHGDGRNPLAFMGGVHGAISALSSSYCAVSATPTGQLVEVLQNFTAATNLPLSIKASLAAAQTSSYSDPLPSSATAVSFYYTPALTGTAAWNVGDPIETSPVRTWREEIVATAVPNEGVQGKVDVLAVGLLAVGLAGMV